MLPSPFSQALIFTGPTASGKTGLAVELAQRLDAEIISMDSMAVYRHMDVGTAKPTAEQRRLVPHHLLDVLDPWQSASVAWWLERAAQCSREIESRGRQVLFVGGTPLYLKALMFGLFDGPPADTEVRSRLAEEARSQGPAILHDRLAHVDPLAAERIHPNDLRRVIRALEVFVLTGQPISALQQEWYRESDDNGEPSRVVKAASFDYSDVKAGSFDNAARLAVPTLPAILWLDLPRSELYARINRRVEEMFDGGLFEESLALRRLGHPLSKEANQAVGYAEALAHVDGLCTRAEAIERVQVRTRQFAKRQITWFRHLPNCVPATSELTWKLWQPKMSLVRTDG